MQLSKSCCERNIRFDQIILLLLFNRHSALVHQFRNAYQGIFRTSIAGDKL